MKPSGLACLRCGAGYALAPDRFGCPACASEVPSNLEVVYPERVRVSQGDSGPGPRGLWRYAEALPVPAQDAVSLGEGETPLVPCRALGQQVGVGQLWAKDEGRNPTWSFKDRLASVGVSFARSEGRPGVVLSSSGNAGAAAAAYAARAGIPCIVLTTPSFPAEMQRFMRAYGAVVAALPSPADRWTLNRAVATEWGWFPLSNTFAPPVGSHPIAVEGCKTIAYEIARDLAWDPPDWVLVPVAYGDGLSGIHRGFRELVAAGAIAREPRLAAVEVYPSLSTALASGVEGPRLVEQVGASRAQSVATPQGTYQALRALRESEGAAVVVSDQEIASAHRDLRHVEGLFVEFSAALPLAGLRRLRTMGRIGPRERVVMVVTSGGLKDSEVSVDLGDPVVIEPRLEALEPILGAQHDRG
ncbi:MAG: threonine synthase [Candidatus Dormibacteraceae bacterium]